jgi:acyl CoA:acetate/3-ketoacid CoA transferase beta subunit
LTSLPAIEFTTAELMAVTASHEMKDGQLVVVGLGLPKLYIALAQRTHAPGLRQLNGIGVVDPQPTELATGNAEPRYWCRATYFGSNLDVVGTLLHRGLVDVGFLGAIEVDQYGNNNTSEVARADGGVRRFSGGGIANDIATHAKSVIIVIRHEPRRLVERVFHNTSPGFLEGGDSRRQAGLPGGGTRLVLTDKCVLAYDDQTQRLQVRSIHPGVTPEQLRAATGFPLQVPANTPTTPSPTAEELRLIREELDPAGLYAGAEA